MAEVTNIDVPTGRKDPITIEVDTSDNGSPIIDICTDGVEETLPDKYINVEQKEDGKYTIVFTPPQPDVYNVSIKCGDNHVKHSPLRMNLNRVDSRAVTISKPPSGSLKAGDPITIGFDASDAGRGSLTASCKAEESGDIDVEIIREGFTAQYVVKFQPPHEDVYSLYIKWEGKNVKGSPFKLDMYPILSSKVVASNLKEPEQPGDTIELDLCTEGAGNAELRAECKGVATGNINVEITQSSQYNYHLTAVTPEVYDKYTLEVFFGNKHIPKSPFECTIKGEGTVGVKHPPTTSSLKERQENMKRFDKLSRAKNATALCFLKMNFFGPSGLGKTTTMQRLLRQIANLEALTKSRRQRQSTHLAEVTQALAIVGDEELFQRYSDCIDDEARIIFSYMYDLVQTESKSVSSSTHKPAALSSGSTKSNPSSEYRPLSGFQSPEAEGESKEEDPESVVVQIISRLRSIVGFGKYTETLAGKILLNLVDIGGQPGFMEMFPFLSKGPGIFLAFFPLDKDLDDPCEVSYERDGKKISPFQSTYTIREILSQALAAIKHHITLEAASDPMYASKMESFSNVKPVAILIGTFLDKLELKIKKEILMKSLSPKFPHHESDLKTAINGSLQRVSDSPTDQQMIVSVSADIQSAVQEELKSDTFVKSFEERMKAVMKEKEKAIASVSDNFEGLMNHPKGRKFFTVNNFSGTGEDLDELRKHLQSVFKTFFGEAKLKIMPSWLFLGIVLRREYDIVSIDECIEIGALIYHPNLEEEDDWFRKNVICKPEVVFNSISQLIVGSLMELHCKGEGSNFFDVDNKEWRQKGQFSLETLKRCHNCSQDIEQKLKKRELIPVEKLVLLMEHSHLLAMIKTTEHGEEKIRYFMPAILECATADQLQKPSPTDMDTPSPIKITFEPRYVPIGLFSAMISELVSRGGSKGSLGMSWRLVESHVKRNLVSFYVSAVKHLVTLVAHVNCIEVRVIREDGETSIYDLCSKVLSTVLYLMKEINALVDPIIAFDCQCDGHQSPHSDKLCRLLSDELSGTCFTCEHSKKKIDLTAHQMAWFQQEVDSDGSAYLEAPPCKDKHLSFKWFKKRPRVSEEGNELEVEKVTKRHCEGYFTCEVLKNGEPLFSVYHCLKFADDSSMISLDTEFLYEVRKATEDLRADWYSLAIELGINYDTRKRIERDHRLVEICWRVMLKHWVECSSLIPSWSTLVTALRSPVIHRHVIAEKIASKQDVSDSQLSAPSLLKLSSSQGSLNVDNHLKVIRELTWDLRAQWESLGLELDVDQGTIKAIHKNCLGEPGPCLTALLEEWLISSPTLSLLTDALASPDFKCHNIITKIQTMAAPN